jgi:hypothetical protein
MAGDFASTMQAIVARVLADSQAVLLGVATHVHRSIVEGSEVTGAPGQPVDTGALRTSWQLSFPSPGRALISTNLVYAPIIESGIRPIGSGRGNATGRTGTRITLRSPVGGFHSVQITIDALPRIVAHESARLT